MKSLVTSVLKSPILHFILLGFVADTVWTVSGSVSHFGHTHYRRNRSHTLVTFVVDDDSWKIKDIELIDEERLL